MFEAGGYPGVSAGCVPVSEFEQISSAANTDFSSQILGSNRPEEAREVDGASSSPIDCDIQVHVGVPGVERREVICGRRIFSETRSKGAISRGDRADEQYDHRDELSKRDNRNAA
jgi:hypothetical protein